MPERSNGIGLGLSYGIPDLGISDDWKIPISLVLTGVRILFPAPYIFVTFLRNTL